jgi:gluconokinase
VVIVVMGVSGAGKTTIGRMLAASLGWEFRDGDDLHSAANKSKLRRGIALDDADRAPWLRAIRNLIETMLSAGAGGVVACSALKQSHRDAIIADPDLVQLVYLKGSRKQIGDRIRDRTGHFMSPALEQSQFDTLEEPPDAVVESIAAAPEAIVRSIRANLNL